MKDAIIFTFLGMVSMFGLAFVVLASETCPDTPPWTKIDSGDYEPVEGAVEYCFKAGNYPTVSEIPDGGFGQEGSCSREGIQFCDLSHWSYRKLPISPPYVPSITITITPTITPTNTPGPTATPEPGPTATPKPGEPTDEWHKVEETPELYPAGDK